MKIDSKLNSPLTGEVKSDSRSGKAGGSAAREDAPAGSVDVHVSLLASQLQQIEGRLRGGDVVDAAKVAEIRQAIAEGRFRINPDAVADRLLDTVRELLGEQPKK